MSKRKVTVTIEGTPNANPDVVRAATERAAAAAAYDYMRASR